MTRPLKIQLCATEPSADVLGAALIEALRAEHPDIEVFGCGGPAMAAAGVDSLFDIAPLSVIGPVAALGALAAAVNGANLLAQQAAQENIDASVLIDSWAFSALVAKKIRRLAPSTKLFKYVAPQVWASRPKRAEKLASLFDGVLTLFDFEPALFEVHGARAAFVGHSGFQKMMRERGGGDEFCARHGLGDGPLLLLAPGSRRAEIRHLASRFRQAADILRKTHGDLRILIPVAPGRESDLADVFGDWEAAPVVFGPEEKAAAFDAATAGLVASGTVSTELAIAGTPMVVAYALDPLTAAWAGRVFTGEHISLVNIAAGRRVIPEFLQGGCTPEALGRALAPLLNDEEARRAQTEAFAEALARLGAGGPAAAERAAKTLLDWIEG